MDSRAKYDIQAFRKEYRLNKISHLYSGILHAVWTATLMVSGIILALFHIENLRSVELLAIAIMYFLGSNGEYFFHKHILHKPVKFLRFVYQIHTLEHHHFFTDEHMAFEGHRDWKMVFFPLFAPVGVLVGLFLISKFLLAPIFSENIGYLIMATGYAHFLAYEVIHFCSHVPEHHWIFRLPFLRALQAHHALHHRMSEMAKVNFNVTPPLCDLLYGTFKDSNR